MTERSPCFVHAADLHMGAPLASLGGRLGGTAEQRAERSRELRALASGAFDKLIDEVLESEAAFVVLSGDIYDQAEREVASQLRFVRGLRRLREEAPAPVPVFVVHGNHDPVVNRFRQAAEIPDNVVVFDSGDPQVRSVEVSDFGDVAIAGVSFATTAEPDNLVRRFAQLPAEQGRPLVGVVHANVEGTRGHDPYAPCSVDDLSSSPVDYWALGHVHSRTIEAMGPGRWWAYPGNLQGRSTKPAECGEKGLLRVPFESGGIGVPEFVACDTIRFARPEVDVSSATDIDSVVEAVRESAIAADSAAAGRPVLLAVDLTGRTSIHSQLTNQSDDLLELCREALGGRLDLGEVLRVRVDTLPEIDRDQLLGRGNLLSEVLERIDSIGSGTDDDLTAWITDHVDPQLDNRVAKLLGETAAANDSAASRDLLARAERLLVDSLMAEEGPT